MFGDNQPFSV